MYGFIIEIIDKETDVLMEGPTDVFVLKERIPYFALTKTNEKSIKQYLVIVGVIVMVLAQMRDIIMDVVVFFIRLLAGSR